MTEITFLINNYYDIQGMRIEAFNNIVAFVMENKDEILNSLPNNSILRNYLLDGKYAEFVKKYVVKFYGNGQEMNEKLKEIFKRIENLIWYHNRLYETEKMIYKRLDEWSKDHPFRKEFLNKVRGIGPVLASGIIAWYCTPRTFVIRGVTKYDPETRTIIVKGKKIREKRVLPEYIKVLEYNEKERYLKVYKPEPFRVAKNPSQIWKYSGLDPHQVRKKGKKLDYDPELKSFCWKIGNSFIKFKCFGRKLYEESFKYVRNRSPDWTTKHCINWALRRVVKIFLACCWTKWREMNGLPVTEPYPISILGHSEIITWKDWIEK